MKILAIVGGMRPRLPVSFFGLMKTPLLYRVELVQSMPSPSAIDQAKSQSSERREDRDPAPTVQRLLAA